MTTVFETPPSVGDGATQVRRWWPVTRAGDGARHHRLRAAITALAVAALGVGGILPGTPAVARAGATAASSKRTPSLGDEPFAGDIYQVGGNGDLIPVDPRTAPDNTALYNLAGQPLPATWGKWRIATGISLAKRVTTPSGPATDFKITLGKLIPGGIYSLFYRTFGPDSSNPVCPAIDPTIELTARHPQRQHPGPASFVADGAGSASFHARVAGDLLAAQNVVLAVIYDFSGQTFGPVPNLGESRGCHDSFGADSMRQMLILQK